MIMTWPAVINDMPDRQPSSPFGRIMSVTAACCPGALSGSTELMMSRMRLVSPIADSIGKRARMRWSAPVMMTCLPAAMPRTE